MRERKNRHLGESLLNRQRRMFVLQSKFRLYAQYFRDQDSRVGRIPWWCAYRMQ